MTVMIGAGLCTLLCPLLTPPPHHWSVPFHTHAMIRILDQIIRGWSDNTEGSAESLGSSPTSSDYPAVTTGGRERKSRRKPPAGSMESRARRDMDS